MDAVLSPTSSSSQTDDLNRGIEANKRDVWCEAIGHPDRPLSYHGLHVAMRPASLILNGNDQSVLSGPIMDWTDKTLRRTGLFEKVVDQSSVGIGWNHLEGSMEDARRIASSRICWKTMTRP